MKVKVSMSITYCWNVLYVLHVFKSTGFVWSSTANLVNLVAQEHHAMLDVHRAVHHNTFL